MAAPPSRWRRRFAGSAKAALVARIDGRLVDLTTPVADGVRVEIVTAKDKQGLDVIRHSCARYGRGDLQPWPQTKLVYGPTVEDGFYYDIDLDEPIRPDDFARIEAKMREIAEADKPIVGREMSRQQALEGLKGDKVQDGQIEPGRGRRHQLLFARQRLQGPVPGAARTQHGQSR